MNSQPTGTASPPLGASGTSGPSICLVCGTRLTHFEKQSVTESTEHLARCGGCDLDLYHTVESRGRCQGCRLSAGHPPPPAPPPFGRPGGGSHQTHLEETQPSGHTHCTSCWDLATAGRPPSRICGRCRRPFCPQCLHMGLCITCRIAQDAQANGPSRTPMGSTGRSPGRFRYCPYSFNFCASDRHGQEPAPEPPLELELLAPGCPHTTEHRCYICFRLICPWCCTPARGPGPSFTGEQRTHLLCEECTAGQGPRGFNPYTAGASLEPPHP